MWFKNLQLFKIDGPMSGLESALEKRQLTELGGLERRRIGWLPAHGDLYQYSQANQHLVCLGIEEKILRPC